MSSNRITDELDDMDVGIETNGQIEEEATAGTVPSPPGLAEMDDEQFEKAAAERRNKRLQTCGKEISDVLQKYRCSLAIQQVLVNGVPRGPGEVVIEPR